MHVRVRHGSGLVGRRPILALMHVEVRVKAWAGVDVLAAEHRPQMVVVAELWLYVQAAIIISVVYTYSVPALIGDARLGIGAMFIRLLPAALKLPPLAFGYSGIMAMRLDRMPMFPSTMPRYFTLYFGPT